MTARSVVGSVLSGVAQQALGEGVGGIAFSAILALNPEVAFSLSEPGALFQERTGAAATTPCAVGDPVGSIKNFGTKGGWVVASADASRAILRVTTGGKRYLECDGVDDHYRGSLDALRSVPGWTALAGVRNVSGSASRQPWCVFTPAGISRATLFISGGSFNALGRRLNADSSAQAVGLTHADADVVSTCIGDFTNTDAFTRVNGVQEGENLSWLTAGVSDNDGGEVGLASLGPASNLFGGRIYSTLIFPSVLTGASLGLAERWTAEQVGVSI